MQVGSLSTLEKKLLSIITTTKQSKPSTKCIQGQPPSQSPNSLTISYIMMQKMPPQIKKILEDSFQNIIELAITNCDLRTFENFPKLKSLRNLNVSKNSLRGSFQFVVKNRTIKYIDASNNMISDIKKFQPLRCLKEVSLYAKFNPFDCREEMQTSTRSGGTIVELLKGYGVKYLDKPLITNKEKQKQKQKEKQKQKQKQIKKQQKQLKPSNELPLSKRPSQIFQSMLRQNRQKRTLQRSLHQHLQEEEDYLRRYARRESEIQAMLNSGSLEIFNNLRRVGLRDSSSSSEQNNNNNNRANNRNGGQNTNNNNSNPSINPQPQLQPRPTARQSLPVPQPQSQPNSQSIPPPSADPQPVPSEISISSFSSDQELILQINNMDEFNMDDQNDNDNDNDNDNENENEGNQDNYDDNQNEDGDGNEDQDQDEDQDEPLNFHARFLNLQGSQGIFDVIQDQPRQLFGGRTILRRRSNMPRPMLQDSEENEENDDFQIDSDSGPIV